MVQLEIAVTVGLPDLAQELLQLLNLHLAGLLEVLVQERCLDLLLCLLRLGESLRQWTTPLLSPTMMIGDSG